MAALFKQGALYNSGTDIRLLFLYTWQLQFLPCVDKNSLKGGWPLPSALLVGRILTSY